MHRRGLVKSQRRNICTFWAGPRTQIQVAAGPKPSIDCCVGVMGHLQGAAGALGGSENGRWLRIYGFTDLPPSLPFFSSSSTPFTRTRENQVTARPDYHAPRMLRGIRSSYLDRQ